MKVKIYKPTKTAMQSGEAKTRDWVLEFNSDKPKFIEPLMGWVGSANTMQQVKIKFKTKDEAISYATRNDLDFEIMEPKIRKKVRKSYADNFLYKPA